MMQKSFAVLTLAGLVLASSVHAQEVIRHKIPGSDFPISMAVEIPPGATVVNLSGAVPAQIDPKADTSTTAAYGDMETQTISVLKRIEGNLKLLGMSLSDVVKMQVFLVKDPVLEKTDRDGFMKAYRQFFGTPEQPNLPTRSAFDIAGLSRRGMLIEIEVSAVRPKK